MPTERRPRNRETHEMVRLGDTWSCTARNPRCGYVAASQAEMLAHVTGQQMDLRHLPPLILPGDSEPKEAA